MKAILWVLLMTVSAHAQLRPRHRFAVTGEQVTQAIVKALAEQGYAGEPKVGLLGDVVSRQAEPMLEVGAVERTQGHEAAVRVRCRVQGVCLPFYAVVSWPGGVSRGLVRQPVAGVKNAIAPVVMRAGAAATMVMDDGRAQVRMSVVSLENGAQGRVIRVASPDRKRVYRAEVVNASVLRGSF